LETTLAQLSRLPRVRASPRASDAGMADELRVVLDRPET
jgi:hypothetical protein